MHERPFLAPILFAAHSRAVSSEVDTGSRKENASKQDVSPVLIQSEPIRLQGAFGGREYPQGWLENAGLAARMLGGPAGAVISWSKRKAGVLNW
ncbi:MAG: hypothetical protein ABI561_01650 [Bradyrhizobium sp.]